MTTPIARNIHDPETLCNEHRDLFPHNDVSPLTGLDAEDHPF